MMHIFWTLWYGYNWPSLKGNGPEAIDQTIVYAAIGLMLYPPLRKWSRRELKKVHARLDEAHEKLDHVILHSPDIPEFKKKGS